MESELKRLQDDYPFLTYVEIEGDKSVVGIIQNQNTKSLMVYDFDRLVSSDLKKDFLSYGEQWWYESNAQLPINIFIGKKFDKFAHCLVGFSHKDVVRTVGPIVNLAETFKSSPKKRRTELVKSPTS